MLKLLTPLLFIGLLAGCAMGPNYHRPALDIPDEWQNRDTSFHADTSEVRSKAAWWQLFGDTVLTNLIAVAIQENADVKIAAARVEELLGGYGVARSDFFPKIGAAGTVSRRQAFPSDLIQGEERTRNQFQVNLGRLGDRSVGENPPCN